MLVHGTANDTVRPASSPPMRRHALPASGAECDPDVPTSSCPSYGERRATRAIRASIDVPARRRPGTLRLRIRLPAGRSVSSALVSGRRARFDRATETVDLSGLTGRIEVTLSVVRD